MDPNAVAVASLVVAVAALFVGVVAVPSARPLALVIAVVGVGVAVYLLLPGGGVVGPQGPDGPGSGVTAAPGGPDADGAGPSITVTPASATAGDRVTVTGSGFPANSGVAFRYATVTGQDYPIDGFGQVDAAGRFRAETTLGGPACDETGRILAFLGTNDRLPDTSGPINQPVAEAAVAVACR